LVFQDHYEVDGIALPRIFLSAQTGKGLSSLREMLGNEVIKTAPEDMPASDRRFDLDKNGEN
jgi:GTP-binding protein HflX